MSFCLNCLKEFDENSWTDFHARPILCPSCYWKFRPRFGEFDFHGRRAYALYDYTPLFKTALYRLKGCADLAMAPIFLCKTSSFLRLFFHGTILVPAPSHEDNDRERGFNHVEAIFAQLGLPMAKVLRKTERLKQAGSSLEVRKEVGHRLAIVEPWRLAGKKVLFVDDVVTTGSTALAAARLIDSAHPKSLAFFFLSKVAKKDADRPSPLGSDPSGP